MPQINIQLDSLMDKMEINIKSTREMSDTVKSQIADMLEQVVLSGSSAFITPQAEEEIIVNIHISKIANEITIKITDSNPENLK